jgi:diguanylate cyclase (GGDEF)-like protein
VKIWTQGLSSTRIIAAVALAAILHLTGVLQPASNALSDLRFSLAHRDASGSLAIVEVDSASIRHIGTWPWPRSIHAGAIDKLTELGASAIAIDIDFSSTSSQSGDAALEQALARAGGSVSLAAFREPGSSGRIVSPLEQFAAHAWTACVDVKPDKDGRVRSFLFAQSTADGPCVTMPVLLAGGQADQGTSFNIDFSIDPTTIERISLAELLDGKVAAERIKGRKIIIGATAIELRDFFLVPAYGVVAGPVLQALAAETLLQGRALSPAPDWVFLAGLIGLGGVGVMASRLSLWTFLGSCLALAVAVEAVAALVQIHGSFVVDTAEWHAAILIAAALLVLREVDIGRLLLALSRAETREVWAMLDKVILENFAGIIVADGNGRIRATSREAARILGLDGGLNLTGARLDAVLPEPLGRAVEAAIAAYKEGTGGPQDHVELDCSGDPRTPRILEYALTFSVVDKPGGSTGAAGSFALCLMFRDITDRKLAHDRIERLARYDTLTSIPNRNFFFEHLDRALATTSFQDVGLAHFDLDGFKAVNDCFGHGIGDDLLRGVAARLSRLVGERCLARLGGDEFAIIVTSPPGKVDEDLASLSKSLFQAMQRPFHVGRYEVMVGLSIGLAKHQDAELADDLMKKADAALYQAKGVGGGEARFYDAELDARLREKASLQDELKNALERQEFRVVYQPQVDLSSSELVGAEALLRWESPTRGPVPPSDFIPLAEETGLIVALGEHVLREACMEAVRWPSAAKVAVNISSIQFERSDLVGIVERALADSGLPPSRLCLEITESLFIQDAAGVSEALARLRTLGIEIALDDFGTGYSSLGYINRFPLDKIKIDRSFVRGLPLDAEATAIIRAIIGMSESLHLRVIAEGVETLEQASLLRLIGCAEGQGYFYGKPEPPSALRDLFGQNRLCASA